MTSGHAQSVNGGSTIILPSLQLLRWDGEKKWFAMDQHGNYLAAVELYAFDRLVQFVYDASRTSPAPDKSWRVTLQRSRPSLSEAELTRKLKRELTPGSAIRVSSVGESTLIVLVKDSQTECSQWRRLIVGRYSGEILQERGDD